MEDTRPTSIAVLVRSDALFNSQIFRSCFHSFCTAFKYLFLLDLNEKDRFDSAESHPYNHSA